MSHHGRTVPPSQAAGMSLSTVLVLMLMSSITFIAILSEMVPSGILNHISADLGISDAQAGQMVGIYALASAICAIPLVTATMPSAEPHGLFRHEYANTATGARGRTALVLYVRRIVQNIRSPIAVLRRFGLLAFTAGAVKHWN